MDKKLEDALLDKLMANGDAVLLLSLLENLINNIGPDRSASDYQVVGAQFDLLRALKSRMNQRIRSKI